MKVAIFGGTFDPPHLAHINIVKTALSQLQVDKVIVFPCGIPPHKKANSTKQHRLAMTQLAFEALDVVIDTFELDNQHDSYTFNTVQYVAKQYNTNDITLIVGGDSYLQLDKWYNYQQLLQLVDIAVAPRQHQLDSILQVKDSYPCKTTLLNLDYTELSSSDIRLKQQLMLPIDDLVDTKVLQYINDNALYSQYHYISAQVKAHLSQYRYNHTYYVAKMAIQLAKQYGVDQDKALLASLLHDCAKEMKFTKGQYKVTEGVSAHAKIAAIMAKENFGIQDIDIINAISYHTTGRVGMSTLEKIIYLADKLEQSRDYPTEHLFCDTLNGTLVATMQEIVDVLVQQGKQPNQLTLDAINYYRENNID